MPKQSARHKELPPFDLKAMREAQSLTQIQCAEELCCGQSSIALWESTGNTPELVRKYWLLRFPNANKRRVKAKAKTLAVAP